MYLCRLLSWLNNSTANASTLLLTYPEASIKKMEQNRRAITGKQIMKIVNANQKTLKQMKKFLASGSNNTLLI